MRIVEVCATEVYDAPPVACLARTAAGSSRLKPHPQQRSSDHWRHHAQTGQRQSFTPPLSKISRPLRTENDFLESSASASIFKLQPEHGNDWFGFSFAPDDTPKHFLGVMFFTVL